MGTLGGIPLDVGDVLAKKYRLERLVGEGGTGVVVAARHLQLERDVAIKFLRAALASDEIRLRFEREARAIGQIESEHVVLVLDVGALDDGLAPYMVMEYLEGRDLAKILKEDGPLSIEDAVDCMLQVCEALEGAHQQGIIHRDLKPANLFLTRREDGGPHIKVVDFGISKILDPKMIDNGPKEMTKAFTVLGSPRYMAPEQLRNSKDVDGRADLWSLGAVLFQLLAGKPAFDADNNINVSLAVLTKAAPLLRSVAPHVPAELEAIVDKCLTKDRAGRFQTAAELADALRPLASDPTRESLARLEQAKMEPNVNIGMHVSSEGERIDSEAENDRAADRAAAHGSAPRSVISASHARASAVGRAALVRRSERRLRARGAEVALHHDQAGDRRCGHRRRLARVRHPHRPEDGRAVDGHALHGQRRSALCAVAVVDAWRVTQAAPGPLVRRHRHGRCEPPDAVTIGRWLQAR
jgi:serine/threonine protein kinase